MQMPGRSYTGEGYRYGFNGMEKDDEINGNGNSYTTPFRQYDPRLGRWLSLDPMMATYPHQSAYAAFNNSPIYFKDPTGLEGDPPKTKDGYSYISTTDGIHTYGKLLNETTAEYRNDDGSITKEIRQLIQLAQLVENDGDSFLMDGPKVSLVNKETSRLIGEELEKYIVSTESYVNSVNLNIGFDNLSLSTSIAKTMAIGSSTMFTSSLAKDGLRFNPATGMNYQLRGNLNSRFKPTNISFPRTSGSMALMRSGKYLGRFGEHLVCSRPYRTFVMFQMVKCQ